MFKFIHSEQAKKFDEISILVLTLLRFLQIFVAFSENLNFIRMALLCNVSRPSKYLPNWLCRYSI